MPPLFSLLEISPYMEPLTSLTGWLGWVFLLGIAVAALVRWRQYQTRGEADRRALRACLQVLEAGEILWIAPEGTRRPALLEAKDGMAYLAAQTGAPLLPISVDGTRGLPALPFSRRWKEPGVSLIFGRPFRFEPGLGRDDRSELTKMTAEAMYILAGMLPPARRGVFSDLSQATQETIEWLI